MGYDEFVKMVLPGDGDQGAVRTTGKNGVKGLAVSVVVEIVKEEINSLRIRHYLKSTFHWRWSR